MRYYSIYIYRPGLCSVLTLTMSEKLMSLLSRKKSDNDKDKVPPTAAAKPMVETVDTIESLDEQESWRELSQIKSTCPVIVCILPHVAQDFVASTLLAIGAYPLIPEGKTNN